MSRLENYTDNNYRHLNTNYFFLLFILLLFILLFILLYILLFTLLFILLFILSSVVLFILLSVVHVLFILVPRRTRKPMQGNKYRYNHISPITN